MVSRRNKNRYQTKKISRKVKRTKRVMRSKRKSRPKKRGGSSLFRRNPSDKIKIGDHIRAHNRDFTLVKNLDLSDNTGITGNYRYTVEGTTWKKLTWKKLTKYLRIKTVMFPGKEFLILPSNADSEKKRPVKDTGTTTVHMRTDNYNTYLRGR
mgnify:CR=1 FL=1